MPRHRIGWKRKSRFRRRRKVFVRKNKRRIRRTNYRRRVHNVKKMLNHIPRRICSFQPVQRLVHKVVIKDSFNLTSSYHYGNGRYDEWCSFLETPKMWDEKDSRLLYLNHIYSKFLVNKIVYVLHSFRMEDFSWEKSAVKGKKEVTVDTSNFHTMSHSDVKKALDAGFEIDDRDRGEGDGSRELVYYFNNTGVQPKVHLLGANVYAKRKKLTKYTRIKHTLYCKGHKYCPLAPKAETFPTFLNALEQMDCPTSVNKFQIFVGPSMNGFEPVKGDQGSIEIKQMYFTLQVYVHMTFAGQYPDHEAVTV